MYIFTYRSSYDMIPCGWSSVTVSQPTKTSKSSTATIDGENIAAREATCTGRDTRGAWGRRWARRRARQPLAVAALHCTEPSRLSMLTVMPLLL